MRLVFLILISMLLTPFSICNAETTSKQGLGIRYTSNPNLVADNPTSDFYTKLDSKWYADADDYLLYFGLSWLNYNREKSNNLLSLGISAEKELKSDLLGTYKLAPTVFHRNYINNNAATSDSSFTNTGIGVDLEKSWQPSGDFSYNATAGYDVRQYANFSNRMDHNLHLTGDVGFELNSQVRLMGFGSVGFLISSLSEYTRSYLDLGVGAKGPINAKLTWNTDLLISRNTYLNRSLVQVTEVSNRRGQSSKLDATVKEGYLLSSLSGEISYLHDLNWNMNSGVIISTQNSNNPVNSYNNFETYVSVILKL